MFSAEVYSRVGLDLVTRLGMKSRWRVLREVFERLFEVVRLEGRVLVNAVTSMEYERHTHSLEE